MKGNVWEIVRKEDGTFEMFHKGELLHGSIPDRWLEDQLVRYGFCGEEYRDIRRQLYRSVQKSENCPLAQSKTGRCRNFNLYHSLISSAFALMRAAMLHMLHA
jgi:hypothetical protein